MNLTERINLFITEVATELKSIKVSIGSTSENTGTLARNEEFIHIKKEYWNNNGYPFTGEIPFKNLYNNPIIHITTVWASLSLNKVAINVSNITKTGFKLRISSGVTYNDIGTNIKIYAHIVEGGEL